MAAGPTDFGNLVIVVGADVGPLRKGLSKGHRHFQSFLRGILKDANIVKATLKKGLGGFGKIDIGPAKKNFGALISILDNVTKKSGGLGKLNSFFSSFNKFSSDTKLTQNLDRIRTAFFRLSTILHKFSEDIKPISGPINDMINVFDRLNKTIDETIKLSNKLGKSAFGSAFKGDVEGTVKGLSAKDKPKTPNVTSFARLFTSAKFLNKFGLIAAFNLSKLGTIGTAVLTGLALSFELLSKVITGLISLITKGLVAAFKLMVSVIKTAINVIVSIIKTGFNIILGIISSVMKASVSIMKFAMKAMAASTAILITALGVIIKKTADFELQLAQVFTLLPFTAKPGLDKFKALVIKTLDSLPVEAKKLNEALFDIVSSGFTELADASLVLDAATKVAIGGVTDIKNATQALITILKSYGLEANKSMRVVKDLFEVQRFGRLTFRELATNIGKVAASASLAGVSIKELGSALAVSTLAGVNTTQSVTALNRLFRAFIDPSAQAAKIMQRYGISLEKVGKNGKKVLRPLVEILKQMGVLNNRQLIQIAGSVRSFRALAPLVKRFDEYKRVLREVTKEHDSLNVAFNRITNTLSSQFRMLANQILLLSEKIGSLVSPIVMSGLKTMTNTIRSITKELFKKQATGKSHAEEALSKIIELSGELVYAGTFITSFITSTIRGFKLFKTSIGKELKDIASNIKKTLQDSFNSIDFGGLLDFVIGIGNILLKALLNILESNAAIVAKAAIGFYASVGIGISKGILLGIKNTFIGNRIKNNLDLNKQANQSILDIQNKAKSENRKLNPNELQSIALRGTMVGVRERQNAEDISEFHKSIDDQAKGIQTLIKSSFGRVKSLVTSIDLSSSKSIIDNVKNLFNRSSFIKNADNQRNVFESNNKNISGKKFILENKGIFGDNPLEALSKAIEFSETNNLIEQMIGTSHADAQKGQQILTNILNKGKKPEEMISSINKQQEIFKTMKANAKNFVDVALKSNFPKTALSTGRKIFKDKEQREEYERRISTGVPQELAGKGLKVGRGTNDFEAALAKVGVSLITSLSNALAELTDSSNRVALIDEVIKNVKNSDFIKGKRKKTVAGPLLAFLDTMREKEVSSTEEAKFKEAEKVASERIEESGKVLAESIFKNGQLTISAMTQYTNALDSSVKIANMTIDRLAKLEMEAKIVRAKMDNAAARASADNIDGSGRFQIVPFAEPQF